MALNPANLAPSMVTLIGTTTEHLHDRCKESGDYQGIVFGEDVI